jgi:hypothetical protein
MTPEDQERLEACTLELAEILYRNADNKDALQLKTLEGIELAVREQVLENVSPKIGFFLSRKAVERHLEKQDILKAASAT